MSTDTRPEYGLRQSLRTAILTSSIVSLLFGLAILIWPVKSAFAITIVVAIYAAVAGVLNLAFAFGSTGARTGLRWGAGILGAAFIASSVLAFMNLGESTLLLAIVVSTMLGVSWIFDAMVQFFSLGNRETAWSGGENAHKGWTISSGIISLLAGIALILSPLFAALWIWITIGAFLIVVGVLGIVRAATLEK